MSRKQIFLLIILAILLTPFWMWLGWKLKEPRQLNMFILDKTVLTKSCDEHRSLNWVLTNEKFVKPDKEMYVTDKDYFGFFPLSYEKYTIKDLNGYSDNQLEELSNKYDALYYTDIYGIYHNDWYQGKKDTSEGQDERILNIFKNLFGKKASLERSPLIYGGLHNEDYVLLEKMKKKNKLVLAEFNLLASPSTGGLRRKVEKLFNIKWARWTGRYFTSLDTLKNPELPNWVIHLYRKQHGDTWPFRNSGIVLVHEDETIAILEDQTHLEEEVPFINTFKDAQEKYSLPDKVLYPFWFDITYAPSKDVISYYELRTNARGDSVLRRHGIPKYFPAAIAHEKDYKFYYFSGDFCDNPIQINYMAKLRGIKSLRYFLYDKSDKSDRNRFFWLYYNRITSKVLNDYYDELKREGEK